MWQSFLKDNYADRREWRQYSDAYGLAEKLGYPNADAAWHDNPFIQGSSNPADFGKADLVAYYGKRMRRWDGDKLDREDAFAGPRKDVEWGGQDAPLAWRDAIDKEKTRRGLTVA